MWKFLKKIAFFYENPILSVFQAIIFLFFCKFMDLNLRNFQKICKNLNICFMFYHKFKNLHFYYLNIGDCFEWFALSQWQIRLKTSFVSLRVCHSKRSNRQSLINQFANLHFNLFKHWRLLRSFHSLAMTNQTNLQILAITNGRKWCVFTRHLTAVKINKNLVQIYHKFCFKFDLKFAL